MISLNYLKEILEYDPKTGIFIWKVKKTNNVFVGQRAGSKDKNGYLIIGVDYKAYKAHILAWYYMTGEWPLQDIDHKNEITDDNKYNNLRLATKSQNGINHSKNKNNTSGYKGVRWKKDKNKWQAYINKDHKFYHIGYFLILNDAVKARQIKEKELFGEFAKS